VSAPREWDARAYDSVPQPQQQWGARILELIELSGDETVLEAGCGTGRDAALLLDRLPSGRIIAVDGSEQMLEQLRTRLGPNLSRVTTLKADLRQPLPIPGPVDAVFSVAAFHWVPDHASLFENFATVLRRGGQLVADCGGEGNIARVRAAIASINGDAQAAGPWNFAGVDDTSIRLAAAGFTDINVSLRQDPARLEPGEQLERFLGAVVLGWHLQQMPSSEHRSFVRAVAVQIPDGEIDYVRLTINARRGRAG
jgi:trans-aconitate 2-methyltransferase